MTLAQEKSQSMDNDAKKILMLESEDKDFKIAVIILHGITYAQNGKGGKYQRHKQ